MNDEVTIRREDAQRIFDLAVSADNACSGYMDLDDVTAMRRLAVTLGVDPGQCTGMEFVTRFPHRYNATRTNVPMHRRMITEAREDTEHSVNIIVRRPETDAEVLARLHEVLPEICGAGGYGRCGAGPDDPIHTEGLGS